MASNGKGTAKRKIEVFIDVDSSQDAENSRSKRLKEGGGSKKKPPSSKGVPKGFLIKSLDPPSQRQRPTSPSPVPEDLSPPPNKHPPLPPNPDDRPLPAPKQAFWDTEPAQAASRPKPPTARATSKPPSRQAGPSTSKGKEKAMDVSTQDELDRLQELRGQIDQLEGERHSEAERRKAAASSKSTSLSKPTSTAKLKPASRPGDLSRTPSAYAIPSPHFSTGNGSLDSEPESRNGLHSSTTTVPVPLNDTPMINRNRELRREQNERRKSSMGQRSSRVSESFEAGILANPHPSVDSPDFYTHISPELPEALRIRQLMVWCASRAQTSAPTSQVGSALPKLKPKQESVLRDIQDELMKSLCLGKVDTSLTLEDPKSPGRRRRKMKEHPGNIINRAQEAEYIKQEQAASSEEQRWSELVQSLNTKQATVLSSLNARREKRRTMDDEFVSTWNRDRKGKQRAMDADSEVDAELEARVMSHMWDIPTDVINARDPNYTETLQMLEDELAYMQSDGNGDPAEQELNRRIDMAEQFIDEIYDTVHSATVLASQASLHLRSFSQALAQRFNARIHPSASLPTTSPSGVPSIIPSASASQAVGTSSSLLGQLRVLSTAKPVGDSSDAAKKVAAELERGVGERKLTAIPATPNARRTPRKSATRNGK